MCDDAAASVKAHVIPRSFFRDPLFPNDITRIATGEPGVPSKKSPTGPYDPNILCADCEAKLSPYDNYGYKFFQQPEIEVIYPGTKSEVRVIDNFNYKLLKLFLLAVLWRASVSSHRFYVQVSLGPYETVLRNLIKTDDPGPPEQFPVIFREWVSSTDFIPTLSPFRTTLDGCSFYQIHFDHFMALIKVDGRPLHHRWSIAMLHPEHSLVLLPKEYAGSQEQQIAAMLSRKL